MRVIHHVIISTLFLTTLFGVIPNKKTHLEDEVAARSVSRYAKRYLVVLLLPMMTSPAHFM